MRVRLKGLNSVTCRLADGTRKTYWYAWKGGPRLRGEPGDPEFIASYTEAVTRKVPPPSGMLLSILAKFEETQEFRELADRTKADYKHIIDKRIAPEFNDFPLAALTDKRARGIFKEWRNRLALNSRRQADYAWVVLARIFSVALDYGWIDANPCEKGGRLYGGTRAQSIWTPEQEAAFLASAPEHLHLALLLALYTAQRQGDLLKLKWFAYDCTHIRLQQSKGGVRVKVKVHARLKAALDAMPARRADECILLNSDGEPWTADGFRSSWAKACRKAGIVGVTFHDLRGTAVTRLALAGSTELEIADISGHSVGTVKAILDKHYLCRDGSLGDNAIRKLEKGTNLPNALPNGQDVPTVKV
jgi:integrase